MCSESDRAAQQPATSDSADAINKSSPAEPGRDQQAGFEQTSRDVTPSPLLRHFEEPSFLHPSSILFEVATHVRSYIVPAAIGLFSAARGSQFGIWLACAVFSVSLFVTMVRYFTLRYRISGNDFIVTEGLLFRRVRSVPIRRIQNVDLVQNVLHRMFGVAEVRIETASGKEPEAILRVLTRSQVEQLRAAIFDARTQYANTQHTTIQHASTQPSDPLQLSSGTEGSATDPRPSKVGGLHLSGSPAVSPSSHTTRSSLTQPAPSERLLLAIPLKWLLAAGATSNRGMVLLGILVGLLFQGDYYSGDYRPRMNINPSTLQQWLPDRSDPVKLVVFSVLAVLTLLLLLRLVGMAWYVLRFHGYRLTRVGDDLRISCGLLTRVSASIPRQRIQLISVHRPLLMRWLGLAAIRLETAGGAGRQNEDAAATVSRRWFVPVIRIEEVPRLLSELRPELVWDEGQVAWHAVSPLTGRRLLRLAFFVSLLISLVGMGITRPWGFVAGIAVFPCLAIIARKKSRSKRFARLAWGAAYQSGVLNRKLSFAFYDRFQTLRLTQTPFDRRWKMASLLVDTAAAGPANHAINVHYLDEQFARQQFVELQLAAAQHRPAWN
jgi:putative membrane protein